jgi:PAS domain S-box-containing protein
MIGYDDRPALLLTATDITERKRAEEALRQGEVRFRTLTETADAAILIYQDECFRYANVTAEVTTGYSRDELLHMRLDDLLHPDFTLPFQERTWRIRSGTQVPARYELKIRTHEGRECWLTLSVAVIGYDDRPALLLTATDITGRKQAEEALRASEERYRTLVETAPSGVLLTDIDYTIRFCNQQAARLFGHERVEDIIGKKGTDLITSELSDDPLVQIRTIALLGNSGTLEYELERSNGSPFTAEIMSAAIITPQGMPTGLTIVINDISARKQAERELADTYDKLARMNTILMRSRNLLRAIVDNLDDGLLLLDGGGIIQEANRPLAELLDSKPNEMVGQRWNSLYPRIAPGFPGDLSSDTTLQKHAQWRRRYHRADGTTHILDFQSIALYSSDQNVELLILRVTDATEHVQLQALVMENERFAASGRLAASVAHEINTPLQALQSYLHLAQVAPDADRAAFLGDAMQEIQRVGRIVRQFLDLYRPSAAEYGRVDVNMLLERILLLLGKRLRDQGVQVERNLHTALPRPQGRADEVMQVLLNLMVNALDAMPDGGLLRVHTETHNGSLPVPSVATVAAVAANETNIHETVNANANANDAGDTPRTPRTDEQHILIAISDSGHGISAEFQARIFEPFITTKEEGTGLGLAISSQIIQQHGGHISVESQQGAGSTFRIVLPYTPEEEETEEQAP